MNQVTTYLSRYALLAATLLLMTLAGESGRAVGAGPPADATLTVPHIDVNAVPVWTGQPYHVNGADPAFRYLIVQSYGVTRFARSAAFGQPGLTILFGQDDIYGSVFRYLRQTRVGSRVTVRRHGHTYTYTVRSVVITTPRQAGRLLDQVYRRPTLALVSCTSYWVDTQRVVVLANG